MKLFHRLPLGGIVADIVGKFPPADQACGGDNSASYVISGELLIDVDYCFQNMSFIMNPGSSIKIINGAKLFVNDQNDQTMLNDPEFIPCEKMWKGIIVEDGELIIYDALVQGAEAGITVMPENKISAKYTTFEDNYVGIDFVGNQISQAPYLCDFGQFYGVEFLGTGSLFSRYKNQTTSPPSNDLPISGIRATDYLYLPITGVKSVGGNAPNIYTNMNYGIKLKNTDANTSYSLFHDIVDTGIAAFSSFRNNNYITHKGYGSNPFNDQVAEEEIDFLNCKNGIVIGNMNANISESQFQEIERAGIQFSGCKNKSVDVVKNRIMSDANGIVSVFSTPLDGRMENNVFSPTAINTDGTNILCFEDFSSPAPGNSWQILNNTMENYLGGRRGIMVTNGSNFEIKENDMILNNQKVSGVNGITLEASHFPELDCNSVGNVGTKGVRTSGLKVTTSISGEYECNDFDGWNTGVSFNNDNMRNLFKGNEMSSCNSGLAFNNTAVIGTQQHKGNCWSDNQTLDLGHASADEDLIIRSQFIIRCGGEGGEDACGCDAAVSVGVGASVEDLLFKESFGETETCGDSFCADRSGFLAPALPEDIVDRFQESLYAGNPNTGSLHWMSQFNYLNTLGPNEVENDFGNLEAERPDLNKYVSFWNAVDLGFQNLSTDQNTQVLYAEINSLYDNLRNSTDQDEIVILQDEIADALETYKALRLDEGNSLEMNWQAIVNTAQSFDNSNVNNEQHITNMSFVNQLYADYLLDNQLQLSTTDLQTLHSMASTCIDEGGPAISLARALYFHFSDGFIIESGECIQTRTKKENTAHLPTKTSLFPNPSSGKIVVNLEEDGVLHISNQNGTLLRHITLEKGQHMLDLDLPSGVYLITDNKSLKEKLVIID